MTTFWSATAARDVAAVRGGHVDDDEPGFIEATISSVISRGAGRPGISAVVMTMSTSAACAAYSSAALASKSALVSLA